HRPRTEVLDGVLEALVERPHVQPMPFRDVLEHDVRDLRDRHDDERVEDERHELGRPASSASGGGHGETFLYAKRGRAYTASLAAAPPRADWSSPHEDAGATCRLASRRGAARHRLAHPVLEFEGRGLLDGGVRLRAQRSHRWPR